MQTNSSHTIVTGDAYVQAISARAADRNARAAFRAAVLRLTPQRGSIFDFGAGPGADAKYYAACGFRVFAYDTDEMMCATLRTECAVEIAQQRVTLIESAYEQLLKGGPLRNVHDIDLVTANFAPMNLVPEPAETFEMFHSVAARRGQLLLSVLNPSFLGDMRFAWFWTNKPRLWRNGHFATPGPVNDVWRRSVGELARLAEHRFRLRQVMRGLPTPPWCTVAPFRWLARPTSQYLFLLFEKK
jgi:SAM-dependent methyltransferase